jgi:uncharacterized delta-60 repeat protein
MRGTLLMTFDELINGKGTSGFRVSIGGAYVRQAFFFDSNDLYSTNLNLGDVVRIEQTGTLGEYTWSIIRRDFTTDDEGGDMGIKDTNVTFDEISNTTIQFTASTISNAYKYYYIVTMIETTCFNDGTGFNNDVTEIDILSDGKLLISGDFTSYNGTPANRIIKLNTNGSIDTSFVYGSGFTPDTTNELIELPDGKLIVVGQFTSYNGTAALRIIGLNADGSVNTGFTYGTGFNLDPVPIVLQADGKVVIGGIFWEYNGTASSKIIRLNQNGSVDTSLVVGSGFTTGGTYTDINSYVTALALQSDGKIIASGQFDAYNGTSVTRLARLNSDGSIDNTFNTGTGLNLPASTIAVQSDGKILLGGFFTTYSGVTQNYITRLNTDGTIDTSFSGNTSGFIDEVNKIVIQPDEKILAVGNFTQYNGVSSPNRVIRLNSDGSVDTSFGQAGQGADSRALDIALQDDGIIYIGGRFLTYRGTSAIRIAKINSSGGEAMC